MKTTNQIIQHIDKIIVETPPTNAGHEVILAMTSLIDWIGSEQDTKCASCNKCVWANRGVPSKHYCTKYNKYMHSRTACTEEWETEH